MNGFNFFLKFNFSFTPPQKENYQPSSGILMYNFRIKLVNIIPNFIGENIVPLQNIK